MKPNFALNLSHDGITLLHRVDGGWHSVGEVSLDDAEFSRKMGFLHETAAALENGGVTTKLVIPNSQILFKNVDAPGPSDAERHSQIRTELDGATPYEINDLAYDWCDNGTNIHVAAVARETLAEAEAFALEYGFNPVSFVALPENGLYSGEPFFGTASAASSLLDVGETVEADGVAIAVLGPTPSPRITAQSHSEPVKDVESPRPAEDPQPEHTPDPDLNPDISDTKLTPAEDTAAPTAGASEADVDETATADTPDSGRKPDQIQPTVLSPDIEKADAPKTKTSDPVFSSQRETTVKTVADKPSDAAAKRLENTQSRLSILPEGGLSLAPKLGGANRGDHELKPPKPAPAPKQTPKTSAPDPAKPPAPARSGPNGKSKSAEEILAAAKTQAMANPGTAPPTAPDGSDEAEKMTIFGARKKQVKKGKPRHLGLGLLALLVAVFAIIILWSSFFLNDTVAFWRNDDSIAASQTTDQTADQTTTPQAQSDVGEALAMLTEPGIKRPDPLEELMIVTPQTELAEEPEPAPKIAPVPRPEIKTNTTPDPSRPKTPLSDDDVKTTYSNTGIWQRGPAIPAEPVQDETDTLFLTSADPKIIWNDAIALPRPLDDASAQPLENQSSPVAETTRFDLDTRGLVIATPQGALTPDGVMVYLGPPPVKPAERGNRVPQIVVEPDLRLAGFRPKARPADLVEQRQTAQLGGRSRSELAGFRPKPRPVTEKTEKEADETPTEQAVVLSSKPRHRPRNFAKLVAISRTLTPRSGAEPRALPPSTQASARGSSPSTTKVAKPAVPRSQTIAPTGKTRSSVAKLATTKNALRLKRTSLIGVYGSPSKRRALVRLANGRYVKVKVGQRVDGGKVAAIGESELRYVKGGRTIVLKMPKL
ncbi:MAG TPA: hypothetical protein DD729_03245 [Rhodobacteraceae bacterium]|nr:hypothetical protein [Paracoccaceae bacterium]